jgi:hypothetical protein
VARRRNRQDSEEDDDLADEVGRARSDDGDDGGDDAERSLESLQYAVQNVYDQQRMHAVKDTASFSLFFFPVPQQSRTLPASEIGHFTGHQRHISTEDSGQVQKKGDAHDHHLQGISGDDGYADAAAAFLMLSIFAAAIISFPGLLLAGQVYMLGGSE